MAGAYVAVGALAAVRRARQSGDGEIIDCSLLEVSNLTGATFADLAYQLLGRPEPTGPARTVEAPSVEPTADGFVGFNTNTRQQFNDFLVLIERADLLDDDDWAMAVNRMRRLDEWNEIVHAWTRNHTTAEIVEAASLFRIPVAEVNNGKTVLENEHFRARGVFAEDVDGGFVKPLPPYLIDGERLRPRGRAPRLGEHQGRIEPRQRPVPPRSAQPVPLPLAGIRVVDTTAWWAGPTVTQIMAALGADVIHVESPRRPDAGRTATLGGTHNVSAWWERAFIFLAANTNKRGLTLDMSTPTGLELAERLIAASDVVVENFSPRVFDTFGFSQDRLLGLNPRLVAVRMPAFGLDGPWRDFVGFAQTMEQMTGMAWITGHPDDQPRIPRGPCDPLAGIHAAFAVLLGLSRRDLTGVGVFIEVAMVETALNAAAEQVIEYTAHGRILERQGNRGPDAAPQGLYRCLGPDSWLALAVANDAQWEALKGVLGNPPWVNKPEFSTPAGRRLGHDAIDGELQVFASSCEVSDIVERLVQAGVPAGQVHDPRRMDSHPQLRARGYFEPLDHPVVGPHAVPSLPFRFASLDRWFRTSAPTFGQHNHAILGDILGLDAASIEQLEAEGVIATRPSGL
jgi:crotonobetainyl-CoA:carnitine CoA-transferase CaiB-like acyl-CoA transferase